MFEKAFLTGYENMVKSKSDLDRLKCMPQKVEGGVLIDFSGKKLIGGLDVKDMTVCDADRVNEAKRFTPTLSKEYFEGFNKLMSLLGGSDTDEEDVAVREVYGADIYDAVAAGDKKALREILKEYKKTKWSALDEDDVEDAIDDIKDCLADKDVDGAKEIVNDLIGCDICEDEVSDKGETLDVPTSNDKEPDPTYTPANEDEAELLMDLEEALADEDYEDVEMLLKELGTDHPRYAEFEAKLPGKGTAADDTNDSDDEEDDVIGEICEDIDAALEDGDTAKAKDFLEELGEEAGTDSDEYKEYEVKVNPPKERTRRLSRRGK